MCQHDERHASHRIHINRADKVERPVVPHIHQPENHADHRGKHKGKEAQQQCVPHRLQKHCPICLNYH